MKLPKARCLTLVVFFFNHHSLTEEGEEEEEEKDWKILTGQAML
uniref:Uncharacterized protein n=1 Tax=Rhizophora mucronata TaxID=61149 RepID=A0A2P2JZB3_RHIMU